MKAIGIVAEYNPFHSGHAWHIAETRRQLGGEREIVCVMSGSWVQRGECALTDKWTRTGLALAGGADLVLELPLPWSISSAEGFARGAVETLKATGVVGALSFGSESGRLADLCRVAEAAQGEDFRIALHAELDKGISFAQARQRAAALTVGKAADCLRGANDSLGVEYIRAGGDDLVMTAIRRQGVSHDSGRVQGDFASASCLREWARSGAWDELVRCVPPGTAEALQGAGLASMSHVERGMLARLRGLEEADWARLPDSGAQEGLPARLVRAAKAAGSLEEFYSLAKTRRYAHARIRRLALWAFLGLTAGDRPQSPLYLRVLGFNDRGRKLLREMKQTAQLPVLTKTSHVRELNAQAQRLFALECRATDLFALCFDKVRPCGADHTTGPVRV